MRYERLELDLSTAACDALEKILVADTAQGTRDPHVEAELLNLTNELRARLQRRDPDPRARSPLED